MLAQPINLNICKTKVGKTILNHGVPVSLSAGVMDTEDPLRVRKAGGAGVRVGSPTGVGLIAVAFYIRNIGFLKKLIYSCVFMVIK